VTVNRESYNAIAADWDAARCGFRGREREYLDALLEGLAAGAQVLDLGCGTGRPIAEYVLAKGYRLTGVDQAEELLKLARSRFPRAKWVHSRIESFVSAMRFKAIICWDALFHIDRSQHEALLARFAEMLEPGGRLMLTFGGSDHPAFTDQMFAQTFFYDSHPPERALALLAARGFVPVISEFTDLPTAGRDKGRYAFVGRLA